MTHPGLPYIWGMAVWGAIVIFGLWALFVPPPGEKRARDLNKLPVAGRWLRMLAGSPWALLVFKGITAALFLLVIAAGLSGTLIPERNLATVLTWNLWWTGIIISIFFLGSAWCAICPWDTLASLLVRRRLWGRAPPGNSLGLRVPAKLRSVWPALAMFAGLTWLELGVGVTDSPYATAVLAMIMTVLATVSLALFERKAFCRYFCPVGRTVGFYSQLAPVELRPIDPEICAHCTSLECYHGSDTAESCPTSLVMGRLQQNTYCTSCGNCTQSCPRQNISWRLRPQSLEAMQEARPHWDEAWFMLVLLSLTAFHGITMMPFWEQWITPLAQWLGDSGRLLWSFSVGLTICTLAPILVYALLIELTRRLTGLGFKQLFSGLAFVALPLAFAYHLAHNLNHLVREGDGIAAVFINPLGMDTLPLSMMEKHTRHLELLLPQDILFAIQAGFMIFGIWIAVQVIRYRAASLFPPGRLTVPWRLFPMILFAAGFTGFHLWLLMQPMVMRM
ncbi:MAG: 4Fe-4S binding protein [Gammaproteobacteria bacterium]|nr:4Fe-4S binding protein [Gammaproteobacteria bacterium]